MPDLTPERDPRVDPIPGDAFLGKCSQKVVTRRFGRYVAYRCTLLVMAAWYVPPESIQHIARWRKWAKNAEVVKHA